MNYSALWCLLEEGVGIVKGVGKISKTYLAGGGLE